MISRMLDPKKKLNNLHFSTHSGLETWRQFCSMFPPKKSAKNNNVLQKCWKSLTNTLMNEK